MRESLRTPVVDGAPTRSRIGQRGTLRFLMEAGQTLSSTLEYEKTLQVLADLAVPRIACFCVVDILGSGGRARRVAMAHADPGQVGTLARVTSFAPVPTSRSPLARVVETGDPMLFSQVDDDRIRETAGGDEEHLALLRQLAMTSVILVPLAARGNALGALVLGSVRADRCYTPGDLDLARELGRIASVAIDNARLYQQAQDALRMRETVLRVVAHDLRGPLGTVSMAASLLQEKGPAEVRTGSLGRALQAIRNSTQLADRLIQDLLDVTRIETGRLTIESAPMPAAWLVEEAVELHRRAAEGRGIELHASPSERLPWVMADHQRAMQVLGNLIGNALKFTPKGGRVDVCGKGEEHEVHLWVADTGPGIGPDLLPHLFDAFWQGNRTDRRGLGLGLTIVKGLVEAHGGRTWVESTVGVGTRVHFTLPLAPGR